MKLIKRFLYPECIPGLSVLEAELDLAERIRRIISTGKGSENIDVEVHLSNQCQNSHNMTVTLALFGLYRYVLLSCLGINHV
jgi:hypothetical protein